MGIYRCNGCGFVAEMPNDGSGGQVAYPQCNRANPVYDTTLFVRKILDMYFSMRRAYKGLQAQMEELKGEPKKELNEQLKEDLKEDLNEDPTKSDGEMACAPTTSLQDINLHNTSVLSTPQQHQPIAQWFQAKGIAVQINHQAVDTSGFFDEVALELGHNLERLRPLLDQIRFAHTRNWSQINVAPDKLSQKDGQAIAAFCRKLYEFSFLARFAHYKVEHKLRLMLQPAPPIRDFFAGEWLEWFALMEVLALVKERQVAFSCARNLHVTFPNEDLHELDVFWLIGTGTPVCIECKAGEFRALIPKYSGMRKRLGLSKQQFVLCVAGLPEDQAMGLTSMYDITLVSERGLRAHVAALF